MKADGLNRSERAANCPLCEGPNECAVAAGQPAESCWCFSAAPAAGVREKLEATKQSDRCACGRAY
jgi:hypothetical protein